MNVAHRFLVMTTFLFRDLIPPVSYPIGGCWTAPLWPVCGPHTDLMSYSGTRGFVSILVRIGGIDAKKAKSGTMDVTQVYSIM